MNGGSNGDGEGVNDDRQHPLDGVLGGIFYLGYLK